MAEESLVKNYNDTGSIIMEMIYGQGFLSPGGEQTAQTLAELSGISRGSQVLDIGSGLGGSALLLAEQKQCSIRGIDLMRTNVAEANSRAQRRGLAERVSFLVGDAHSLPYDEQLFDAVWGQDAWCHVGDKDLLIREIHRVLRTGGRVVFSDWLLRDVNHADADEVRAVTASPRIGDEISYRLLLEKHKFHLEKFVDASSDYAAIYVDVLERLQSKERDIVARFSQRVFDIVRAKQSAVLNAFSSGVLGAGYFVGCKIGN